MHTDLQPLLRNAGRLALAAGILAAFFTAVALTAGTRRPPEKPQVWYGGEVGYDDSLGI